MTPKRRLGGPPAFLIPVRIRKTDIAFRLGPPGPAWPPIGGQHLAAVTPKCLRPGTACSHQSKFSRTRPIARPLHAATGIRHFIGRRTALRTNRGPICQHREVRRHVHRDLHHRMAHVLARALATQFPGRAVRPKAANSRRRLAMDPALGRNPARRKSARSAPRPIATDATVRPRALTRPCGTSGPRTPPTSR